MNKLYPLLLEHHLPVTVRYFLAVAIMLVCSVLQVSLQMLVGHPSYFLLLPGIFLSGLVFDRGTGILAAIIAVGVGAYLGDGSRAASNTSQPTVSLRSRRPAPRWWRNSFAWR